jgi:hypothetical protein
MAPPRYLRGSQHRSQHGEEVRDEGCEEDEGVDETHTDADHVATRRRRQTKRAPRPRRACRAGREVLALQESGRRLHWLGCCF